MERGASYDLRIVGPDHSLDLWRMRMDVSLAMRINEEPGSLRYAVHGIRLLLTVLLIFYPLPSHVVICRGTVTLRSLVPFYDRGNTQY